MNRSTLFTLSMATISTFSSLCFSQTLYETSQFTPESISPNANFGTSMKADSNTLIIGANGWATPGEAFTYDINTLQMKMRFTPSDGQPGDFFGSSVAIHNGYVAVGAPGHFDGAAYVFDATSGQQLYKLMPDDLQTDDSFGSSIVMTGNFVLVGAPTNWGVYDRSGSVYIFDLATGMQLNKLTLNSSEKSLFGYAMDASDGSVFISAAGQSNPSLGTNGIIYKYDTETWTAITTQGIDDNNCIPGDLYCGASFTYGITLAVDNDTILAEAWYSSGTNGGFHSRVYLRQPDSSSQIDVGPKKALDITPRFALTGYTRYEQFPTPNGQARLIDLNNLSTGWDLFPSDPVDKGYGFGQSGVIVGNKVFIGSPIGSPVDRDSGSVYFFDLCPADLTNDGILNFFDISAFLTAFNTQDPIADFTDDGIYDFFDVSAFLLAFNAGCP